LKLHHLKVVTTDMTPTPERALKAAAAATPEGSPQGSHDNALADGRVTHKAQRALAPAQTKTPVTNSASSLSPVTISILAREFKVSVPEAERAKLLQSVEYTNRKMEEVKSSGKVAGNERVAILAALNIAHELLHLRAVLPAVGGLADPADTAALNARLDALSKQLEAAMGAEQAKLF
jgi:cell division protein ZapA